MLHIVAEYKHVGSIITENNNLAPEILKRAARALDAWYQLADRVFGSPHVPTSVKSSLAYSLIFTRLLYAAETWTTLTPASLRVLDTVQARVARRILGTWYTKHDSVDHTTDRADHTTNEEDRRSLGWPSIECELRRKRLAYAARICRYAPDTLRALLQARCAGRPLPWVLTLYDDFEALRIVHAPKLDELPHPSVCMQTWYKFIESYPAAWNEFIRRYIFFTSSALTARGVPIFEHQLIVCTAASTMTAPIPGWYKCQLCPANACRIFPSERALRAHHVAGHNMRCQTRCYIEADGICPVCKLCFHTRIRAIAHAQRRTSTCSREILRCVRLNANRIALLDLEDAATRKATRKSGHPTPLARIPGPAKGPKRKVVSVDLTTNKRVRR